MILQEWKRLLFEHHNLVPFDVLGNDGMQLFSVLLKRGREDNIPVLEKIGNLINLGEGDWKEKKEKIHKNTGGVEPADLKEKKEEIQPSVNLGESSKASPTGEGDETEKAQVQRKIQEFLQMADEGRDEEGSNSKDENPKAKQEGSKTVETIDRGTVERRSKLELELQFTTGLYSKLLQLIKLRQKHYWKADGVTMERINPDLLEKLFYDHQPLWVPDMRRITKRYPFLKSGMIEIWVITEVNYCTKLTLGKGLYVPGDGTGTWPSGYFLNLGGNKIPFGFKAIRMVFCKKGHLQHITGEARLMKQWVFPKSHCSMCPRPKCKEKVEVRLNKSLFKLKASFRCYSELHVASYNAP